MDLGLLKTLREEWPTVRAAPWSFAFVSVMALGLGFGASTLWWSGTVSTLRERVSLYQDRLQGASPDQAARTIKDLTDQVSALQAKEKQQRAREWAPLTPKQTAEWAIHLSKYKPTFLAVFFTDANSEQFRESLYEVFREAQWPNPTVVNAGYLTGIKILAAQNDPVATALFSLIDKTLPMQKAYEYENPPVPGKVQIYIGKLN